jgi:hypothetical protein
MTDRDKRNAAVARVLKELSHGCGHNPEARCTDYETGDIFCGDCADVLTPWKDQTEAQHKTYVWGYGDLPPAQRA